MLYTARCADALSSGGRSRQDAERLRAARRPTAAYGSRVQRRLRGRWFSLVPVRLRTLIIVAACLLAFSGGLCFLHYLSVTWPTMAVHPELTRPLRLDRPDSFGRWISCLLLATASGTSLLIYQLRRYRTDDYEGHYRIWRTVLVVLMLASVNSQSSVVAWAGAIIDVLIGERVVLAGGDWLRLLLTVGGAALSLRLMAEVRASRWSLGLLIVSTLLLSLPTAANWNLIKAESLARWLMITSAPLLAHTVLLLALGVYLRMLYREVRAIEDEAAFSFRVHHVLELWAETRRARRERREQTIREREDAKRERDEQRQQQKRERREAKTKAKPNSSGRTFSEEADQGSDEERSSSNQAGADSGHHGIDASASPETARKPGGWWLLKRKRTKDAAAEPGEEQMDDSADDREETPNETGSSKRMSLSRRLKGMISRTSASTADEEAQQVPGSSADKAPVRKQKRRRFSLRLAPPQADAAGRDDLADGDSGANQASGAAKPRRRFGLFGRRPSRNANEQSSRGDAEADQQEGSERGRTGGSDQPHGQSSALSHSDGETTVDADDIDWSQLSKSERRRLRKQLKRQNRAA